MPESQEPRPPGRRHLLVMSLTALGVVFGDIGTSPLYAVRECFGGILDLAPTRGNVLGILSLIFWTLILIVTVKYLAFVLRADNHGECGILALMALVHPDDPAAPQKGPGRRGFIIILGLFGAALLYGDGMITPAISVLGAMEGLEVAEPGLSAFVVPLSVAILTGLFLVQARGTAVVGALFGPIILVWFFALAALGIFGILQAPEVLAALDPWHAVAFFANHGIEGGLVLGAVFLVATGAEALYADMGHLGAGPIRVSWLLVVMPALVLNYFGQGALLLVEPTAVQNPFFHLAPAWALVPLLVLATMAAVIASQAIISGVFSLTLQAVQLGYLPRVLIRHTSERMIGQIYIPLANWTLFGATVLLVIGFGSSSALAAAYGIAVTLTMVITSLLFWFVATERWDWPKWVATALVAVFLVLELAFLAANAVKFAGGGWVPIAVAVAALITMTTWRHGRAILAERLRARSLPLAEFIDKLRQHPPTRVRGQAVYMTANPRRAPPALIKNLEHHHSLHMRVILLSIVTADVPRVPRDERYEVEAIGMGFHQVVTRLGFMQEPDATQILRDLKPYGLDIAIGDTSFFLGRERLVPLRGTGMARWRIRLFGFMSRNAQHVVEHFHIPPDRVVEVGSQVPV